MPEYDWDRAHREAIRRMEKIHHTPWHQDPLYNAAERIRAKRREAISLAGRASGEARREMKGPPTMETRMTKTVDAGFNAAVAEAVAQALAGMNGTKRVRKTKGKGREKPTPEVTAARKAANDAECIKVFTAAGYKDVQPRVNVLTYGKEPQADRPATGWLAQGRKVKKGEKSHQVGPFRLFHFDQTEAIAPQ